LTKTTDLLKKGLAFESRGAKVKSYHSQNILLHLRWEKKLRSLSAVTSGPYVVKNQNFWRVKKRFLDNQLWATFGYTVPVKDSGSWYLMIV
jgi:hypothetical protein